MAEFLVQSFKIDLTIYTILLTISAFVLVFTCFRLIISKNLIESLIIMSIFSLFIGICYLLLDAPDVAMTETALATCLSTCVLLNLIIIFGETTSPAKPIRFTLAVILCLIFVVCLTWASVDLPKFGEVNSPLQTHISKYYLENTKVDIAIPSIVAAILASYRGYDTLGETTVILIAGLAVLLILSRRKSRNA